MKPIRSSLVVILGLTLAVGSSAFASTITFYLNTDETPGQPPANTIEVQVNVTSVDAATVTVTNLSSNSSYNIANFFLNVNGSSEIGNCTSGVGCATYITGTGTGNGPYYYVSNQGGGYGAMTYNVVDTGKAATSITVDLTAIDGNSWANAYEVLTANTFGTGYSASVDLGTQSGYQAAGKDAAPEPPGMLLLGVGLLALGLLTAFQRQTAKRSLAPVKSFPGTKAQTRMRSHAS